MAPLGRKHYKDNTGGKHKTKMNGITCAWWTDVCGPNKKADRRKAKEEIKEWIDV